MAILAQQLPRTLVFGKGCVARVAGDLAKRGVKRVFFVSGPSTGKLAGPVAEEVRRGGAEAVVWDRVAHEPTVGVLEEALAAAREFRADAVVGFGGGSPLDVAKLVAGLYDGRQRVREVFGIGKLEGRALHLACVATTAGTGSEVSPNAILLDEGDSLKKGVISPHLVPDAAYVDPALMVGVPRGVTAATGMDALTHCIEAYANRYAHPMIDLYALEGVRLIAGNLERAVEDGADLEARSAVALGSLYGGMCLGPVNTGAVHALAYPLGGEFRVAHGVSNAVLLPHVLEFNLPAAAGRYANVAVAMGVERGASDEETARRGLERIKELGRRCGVPGRLAELSIGDDAVERMARSAMTVTRLLERNVRAVTFEDSCAIYRRAL